MNRFFQSKILINEREVCFSLFPEQNWPGYLKFFFSNSGISALKACVRIVSVSGLSLDFMLGKILNVRKM